MARSGSYLRDNDVMASFSLTRRLPAGNAWAELVEHPELLLGLAAPDLAPGNTFTAVSHAGSASGTIESVAGDSVGFSWRLGGWPEPARLQVDIGTQLRIEAGGVPDADLAVVQKHWERVANDTADYLASPDPATDRPAAVLFDADGVLQTPRKGWLDEFVGLGGPGFVAEAFTAEGKCLSGEQELLPLLREILDRSGAEGTAEEVIEVWNTIDVDPDALEVVRRVRDTGLPVGLATNQQSSRGAVMRDVLGLDQHFDHHFYSYLVGAAKPSADYFERVIDELGVSADRVVFVDDMPANVVAARKVGLRGVLHRTSTGASGLANGLAAIGVPVH